MIGRNVANMKPSNKGPSSAYCNICSTDFSVASGGVLFSMVRKIETEE